MTQFEIYTYSSQIFWLIIAFSFLYLFIYKFVTPRANLIAQHRQEVIDENFREADFLAQAVESLKHEYNIRHKEILDAAENIKKESIDNLNNSFAQKKLILTEELKSRSNQYMQDTEQMTKAFIAEQSEACIDLAKFIVSQVTNKEVDLTLLTKCYESIK